MKHLLSIRTRSQYILALALILSACVTTPEGGINTTATETLCSAPISPPKTQPKAKPVLCPVKPRPTCPSVKPRSCPISPAARIADKLVIGAVENVYIDPPQQTFKARIDTGAAGTSIHASNITPFERDGRDWVRFEINHPTMAMPITIERPLARTVLVKQASADAPERRMVIKMTLTLGPLTEQVDVSLSERTSMAYPVLVGRNFLRNLAIVDVSQRLIVK